MAFKNRDDMRGDVKPADVPDEGIIKEAQPIKGQPWLEQVQAREDVKFDNKYEGICKFAAAASSNWNATHLLEHSSAEF